MKRYPSPEEVSIPFKCNKINFMFFQLREMVEVRQCEPESKGVGLFCTTVSIPKGTRVAVFAGKPIVCIDDNDNVIRSKPTGVYIIQVDEEGHLFLDCAGCPKFGEPGYTRSTGHFVNSCHPELRFPDNTANCEMVCGPGDFDVAVVTIEDIAHGEEFLLDYHQQLTKIGIAQSCGCYECEETKESPDWSPVSYSSTTQHNLSCACACVCACVFLLVLVRVCVCV